eukprot:2759684-Amphidinium_carterae.2
MAQEAKPVEPEPGAENHVRKPLCAQQKACSRDRRVPMSMRAELADHYTPFHRVQPHMPHLERWIPGSRRSRQRAALHCSCLNSGTPGTNVNGAKPCWPASKQSAS